MQSPPRSDRFAAPIPVYLLLAGGRAFFYCLMFTVSMIYQATVADLSPFEMVMVGTVLEATMFLFEGVTGVVADVYSRKLSIVIGYLLIGTGFLLEGAIPQLWAILLAQIVWGIGATFTSGATEAWITDEVGADRVGNVFLRGTQMDLLGGIPGLVVAALLGLIAVQLPIILAGIGMVALGVVMLVKMPERHMQRHPRTERTTLTHMRTTLVAGFQVAARRPLVRTLIVIGLISGAAGEAFDRLGNIYLIEFDFPEIFGTDDVVVWFAVIGIATSIIEITASEAFRRVLPSVFKVGSPGTTMAVLSVVQVVATLVFALAGSVWLILGARMVRAVASTLMKPVEAAWLNRNLDPATRATVLSFRSQMNAVGQMAGAPPLGWVASRTSVRSALLVTSLVLAPVVVLYQRTNRQKFLIQTKQQEAD
jgi:DHA3 family tetracycline resistance protein-like MFS transporter